MAGKFTREAQLKGSQNGSQRMFMKSIEEVSEKAIHIIVDGQNRKLSLNKIAEQLNRADCRTRQGKEFHAKQVSRIIQRLEKIRTNTGNVTEEEPSLTGNATLTDSVTQEERQDNVESEILHAKIRGLEKGVSELQKGVSELQEEIEHLRKKNSLINRMKDLLG